MKGLLMDKRRELSKSYVETWKPKGVFAIKCKQNGKMYIDSTKNFTAIQNRIFFELKLGSSYQRELQEDYKTFGPDAFEFVILEEIKQQEDPAYDYTYELEEMLKKHLEQIMPYGDKGYNGNAPRRR